MSKPEAGDLIAPAGSWTNRSPEYLMQSSSLSPRAERKILSLGVLGCQENVRR